jgi:hypothetical protein
MTYFNVFIVILQGKTVKLRQFPLDKDKQPVKSVRTLVDILPIMDSVNGFKAHI